MNEDRLKKFVDDNREEFDIFEPRPELWQDISRQLHAGQPAQRYPFQRSLWAYAAALAVLLVMSVLAWKMTRPETASGVQVAGQSLPLEQIAPEIAEAETYYTRLISEMQKELSGYDLEALGINDNFGRDIAALDSAYNRLKGELYTNPNQEPIIDAMIQNLQLRMEVLSQQIQTLNTIRRMKKTKKTTTNGNVHA